MPRILLVEDEELSALVMSNVLSEDGYEVVKAATYQQAIDAASRSTPELLITDWQLNDGFTGNDIATELSKQISSLGVIFISGFDTREIRAAAQHLRVLAIIEKPCDFDEVLALVKKNLPHE